MTVNKECKMKKPAKPEMMPALENGQHVWIVFLGGQVKYAWPRNGMTSREVAEQLIKNW